jgi:hypothetical protein
MRTVFILSQGVDQEARRSEGGLGKLADFLGERGLFDS